jgi:hypothetical chaperone protein
MTRTIGLDFGTTNSALAIAGDDGAVKLARFDDGADTFRSILHFQDARGGPTSAAGSAAIERYLAAEAPGRLLQSLKSYLADRSFDKTSVFGRPFTIEDLATVLLRAIVASAERSLGPLPRRAVVGRPVHFANADGEADAELAEGRLLRALSAAGFEEVTFEYEPVAAAWYYERRLDHDEVVLVADFGGGTSDFSLMEVGPGAKRRARRILGNDGVGLAGDALDARIVDHVVAPALGQGSTYRSMFDRELDVPVWLYAKLRRWHHLSFLKSKKTLELLREIEDCAARPEPIEAFRHIVEDDLGFRLARAVEATKVALSKSDTARFSFVEPPAVIERSVTRADFERWIAPELDAIGGCVDRLLASASLDARDVDRVFMTGGSSLVPAVRQLFERRFGAARLAAGGELVSVASGLALRAADTEAP